MPDLIRGFISGGPIRIRNPRSTRPWQHVLDPLHGYLLALEAILGGADFKSMNFGPDSDSLTVQQMIEICIAQWPVKIEIEYEVELKDSHVEAIGLQLNSNLANTELKWEPYWNQEAAGVATVRWWDSILSQAQRPLDVCLQDIANILRNS